MLFDYPYCIVALCGLVVDVAVQIVFFRLTGCRSLLKSEAVGFIAGGAAVLAVQAGGIRDLDTVFLLVGNLTGYACLGYCYFHFVNLGETARRVRILRELCASATGLRRDELLARYNAREVTERRLSRLLATGQLTQRQGRYFIGSRCVLTIASILLFARTVIFGTTTAIKA